MLFLAYILNRPVLDAEGIRLGWVEDLVLTSLDLFPRVDAIVLARRGQGAAIIPWQAVARIDDHAVVLSAARAHLPTSPLEEDAIFLRRDILDKQVVDINGRKVVRVNDLQLADIDHELRLIGADIGVTGLLRRLSLERPLAAISRYTKTALPERVIPWNYVEGLATDWPSVRLSVTHRRLRDLPATDIAEIVAQLQPDDRQELLNTIDDETLADTLPHLEDDMQADVIRAMPAQRASDIIEFLPPDEAADVLGDLSREQAEQILHLLEPKEAEDLRELLRYSDDTAGGLMTTEFVALSREMTVEQALAHMREIAPDTETIYYLYVVDADEHLEGVLSLRDLITSPGEDSIADFTRHEVIQVNVYDDQETVARVLNRYHLLAVPVTDADGVLRGIVTVDDVLDVLHEEAEEDQSRLVGAVEESDVLATPWEQTLLRLPWVLTSMLAGMAVAVYLTPTILAYPGSLTLLLALLPLLLLIGIQLGGQGAVATQVALADGATFGEIILGHLRRFWPVGVALAVLAAAAGGAMAQLIDIQVHILPVAGVVLLVSLVDMLVGSLLPLLLHRLRWDPILVSRPALAILALLVGVPLLVRMV